ncbi:MAG TPA: hypothetical protein VFF27_06450 [Bacteroidia bacterium]|jgi:hypothetical protein|nr:hypothetical protein [Bacteroidia bacterium]
MKNNKIEFAKLQTLKVEGDVLKAGFSTSFSGGYTSTDEKPATNSGNCVSGCAGTINRFICVGG